MRHRPIAVLLAAMALAGCSQIGSGGRSEVTAFYRPSLVTYVARDRTFPMVVHGDPFGLPEEQTADAVRGADVFVVQPTCPPVNDNLFELLSFGDCLRRASADRITAVAKRFLGVDVDVVGSVRFDRHVPAAVTRRTPVVTAHPRCRAARDIAAPAERLAVRV